MDQEHQPIPQAGQPLRQRWQGEIRVLAVLGGPIVVTQLLQMATGVVDTIMSGRASAQDLAGVSIGVSLWIPIFLFSLGTLMALTPVVAHARGAQQDDEIAPAVYQGFWISLLASVLIVALLVNIDPVLGWINVNDEIRPITAGYLYAMAFGMPAILGFNVLRAYADGLSLTRPAMIASIISLAVNVPLNYVLIYGKLGFPAFGGVGCGWASAAALWVSFAVMIGYVALARGFRGTWLFTRVHPPQWQQIKALLKLGVPIGCSYLVESSMFSVIALFLAVYGAVVVASHQIALNVASLVFMIPLSLGLALTIRVGFLSGAGQPLAARFSAFTGVALALIYGTVSAVCLWVFAPTIVSWYTPEYQVQRLAAELLVLAAVFQLTDAVQVTCAGALRGYKDTAVPMVMTVVAFWLLCLPLGYGLGMTDWFGPALQARGFWIGLVLGLSVAAVFLSTRLYLLSRRRILPPQTGHGFSAQVR
ncbi:MATE family efflux transporter [Exilibacterium tricleocarpae]|uniref:Multidrug-efflux transporter n=1 Tax=Exilibacterium tricleocarpae TaxID=2591008 RepID=A0A545U5N5_9GAMM|nr:MATE family efflux transporter [Exilibacterium tricleocarpae]TQV84779.1 MATE family efflux transporter [Exilibacterium tricleocarpae]